MKEYNLSDLKRALYKAEMAEVEKLDSLPTVNAEHTQGFLDWVKALLTTAKREEYFRTKFKKRRLILVAAIITALLLAAVACATIEPIRNYIMEITGISTTFKSNPDAEQDDGSNENSQDTYEAGLNYVPTGFVIDDSWQINDSNWFECMYRKEETRITYSKMTIASTSSSFDSEGTPTKILNIDGKEVFLFTKWKTDQAVWHDEVYRYVIAYPEELDFSEVEKMIKSAR
jgi:hypothetical protein